MPPELPARAVPLLSGALIAALGGCGDASRTQLETSTWRAFSPAADGGSIVYDITRSGRDRYSGRYRELPVGHEQDLASATVDRPIEHAHYTRGHFSGEVALERQAGETEQLGICLTYEDHQQEGRAWRVLAHDDNRDRDLVFLRIDP